MVKSPLEQDIIDALEARASEHGIDVVDVDIVGATKAPCVRVRIDHLEGEPITLDEVTANNAWVSEVIETLDPISGSYTLEVSSPGMARPLRRPADFARFEGEQVDISTTATEGRRRYKGVILSSTDAQVTLALEDGETAQIPFAEIKKAALHPVFDFSPKKEGN